MGWEFAELLGMHPTSMGAGQPRVEPAVAAEAS
jgi:hypothetical protein